MTKERLKEIFQIVKKIKPKKLKIRFIGEIYWYESDCIGVFYFTSSGPEVWIKKGLGNLCCSHVLLHEVSHHLTAKKEWYVNTGRHRTWYLCEYLAEKKLRKICREYELYDVLEYSTRWIEHIIKKGDKVDRDYKFMAQRIAREEL